MLLLTSARFRESGISFCVYLHAVLVCKARWPAVFNDFLFLHQKSTQHDVVSGLFSLLSLFLTSLTNLLAGNDLSIVSSGGFVIALCRMLVNAA